ncbi:MAG: hypothetical protein J7L16_07670 [Deltaproteobacteria bacterium]|nr:hypothetical protein [Deltaproteobacteria bacterium]
MNVFDKLKEVLMEILDIEDREIGPETYIIRELDAESIDLLELAVAIGSEFDIEVNDDEIFMKELRPFVSESEEKGKALVQGLVEKYPFISNERAKEIISDLDDGPVLKVKDLAGYVAWIREHEQK